MFIIIAFPLTLRLRPTSPSGISIAACISSCALRAAVVFCRNYYMSNKGPQQKEGSQQKAPLDNAMNGEPLGVEGRELKKGLWEIGVYLGKDGFVYHITASQKAGGIHSKVQGKRTVGEYLRWVDGLFRPGELPSESNGVHYRA